MSVVYEVHKTATVDPNAEIGDGTHIWHYAHVRGGAKIGRDCVIGKDVYIDADVRIGDNVKIQNGVSVYKGVVIEDRVFIGPNVTFTNDLHPRATGRWEVCHTHIGADASIGAGAVILCGFAIGQGAMIGAGSVVTGPVFAYSLMRGHPARHVGYVCQCGQPMTMAHGVSSPMDRREISEAGHSWRCEKCRRILRVNLEWQ